MATERRFLPTATLRIKRSGEGDKQRISIVGHASVFNQWTTLYEGRYFTWREIVRKGAFASAIKDKHDVRGLFNHDPNYVLGRTTSGTVKLKEDKTGLLTQIDPPDTQTIRDLVVGPIERGDVTGMSFAFGVRVGNNVVTEEIGDTTITTNGGERVTIRREGERVIEERELLDLDLYDVSPVTYPAYDGTDVSMRSRLLGIEERIREMDKPHRVLSPLRDACKQWLEGHRA